MSHNASLPSLEEMSTYACSFTPVAGEHLHWSRSTLGFSIMNFIQHRWAASFESVLSVLCGVSIMWLHHRQKPSSFPSSPPPCLYPVFVLLFNYIVFQTSSMCPILLTSHWTLGIALQLNTTVVFSNSDLPAALSPPFYLVLSLSCF